jgi:hypothetical protein
MTRIYVHEARDVRMRVIEVSDPEATLRDLLELDEGDLVWLESSEDLEPDQLDVAASFGTLQLPDGAHLFRGRCKKVKTTLRYAGDDLEHPFGPNAPLRRVLRWAVGKKGFDIDPDDADELGLQVCGTDERPDLAEHLGSFAENCAACFDIVPKDRFQG